MDFAEERMKIKDYVIQYYNLDWGDLESMQR